MQDVEADVGESVSQVTGVVRRHAADVEANRPAAAWLELEAATAAGVVQPEGHAADSIGASAASLSGCAEPRRIRPPGGRLFGWIHLRGVVPSSWKSCAGS